MLILDTPPADRHTPAEDIQGILIGTLLVAMGIQFLAASDLITGQIAGLALVMNYAGLGSFGLLFFLLNLPFYVFAFRQMGPGFTVKSFTAVALMSGFAETLPFVLTIQNLHPGVGAVLFGVSAGVGLLSLFRHGASLGGIGITGLYLQDRFGIKAGWVQLGFDLCVFAGAFALFPADIVGYLLLGAVVLNLIVTINHRRDRYIARS